MKKSGPERRIDRMPSMRHVKSGRLRTELTLSGMSSTLLTKKLVFLILMMSRRLQ